MTTTRGSGFPRMTWALRAKGQRVGKNRAARLMRQKALGPKAARKFKATTHSGTICRWPLTS